MCVGATGVSRSHKGSAADGQSPADALAGPSAGRPGRDRYYTTRVRQLLHIDVTEEQAAELWRAVTRHRAELRRLLGRDVGQRVALLDFVVNVRRQLVDPKIVDRPTLEEIEHRAVMDSITGLYNRYYFEQALRREIERCRRSGAVSSLLLLDLDGLKRVNDRHGHWYGDQALQAVGAAALRHVRAADIPCRYGGDEFGFILTDTSPPVALAVAGRICEEVAAHFRRHLIGGRRLRVTVSAGVAPVSAESSSPEQAFIEADRALYDAKGAGGNRVAAASSAPGAA